MQSTEKILHFFVPLVPEIIFSSQDWYFYLPIFFFFETAHMPKKGSPCVTFGMIVMLGTRPWCKRCLKETFFANEVCDNC